MQNPYDDIAAYYDCEHDAFDDDIAFYLGLLTEGPVLEIGAGTGRVMAPLSAAGLDVWGVEPSEAMLARARTRLSATSLAHLVPGTAADLRLDVRFAAALLPLNTMWHLHTLQDRLDALRVIHEHLRPDGLLVIDLSNPYTVADRGAKGEVRERFTRQCGDALVTCRAATWDDEGEQVFTLSLTYDRVESDGTVRRTHVPLELRYLYRGELEATLHAAGFTVHALYGTYDLDPYTGDSPNLIALAGLASAP